MPDKNVKRAIFEAVEECYEKANRFYGLDLKIPEIQFWSKLQVNGSIRWNTRTKTVYYIRFNTTQAKGDIDKFLKDTVPHEVAHHVDIARRGRTLHDLAWKSICLRLGGSGSRCTMYNMKDVPVPKGYFAYACKCGVFHLTKIRHNKIVRGKKYVCRNCMQEIEHVK